MFLYPFEGFMVQTKEFVKFAPEMWNGVLQVFPKQLPGLVTFSL